MAARIVQRREYTDAKQCHGIARTVNGRTLRKIKNMASRKYPLKLILRAHGPAELTNADDETLWASDADDDFREEFNDEFLQEEDIEDILDYLFDAEILSMNETDNLASDRWPVEIETLESSAGEQDLDESEYDDKE